MFRLKRNHWSNLSGIHNQFVSIAIPLARMTFARAHKYPLLENAPTLGTISEEFKWNCGIKQHRLLSGSHANKNYVPGVVHYYTKLIRTWQELVELSEHSAMLATRSELCRVQTDGVCWTAWLWGDRAVKVSPASAPSMVQKFLVHISRHSRRCHTCGHEHIYFQVNLHVCGRALIVCLFPKMKQDSGD